MIGVLCHGLLRKKAFFYFKMSAKPVDVSQKKNKFSSRWVALFLLNKTIIVLKK